MDQQLPLPQKRVASLILRRPRVRFAAVFARPVHGRRVDLNLSVQSTNGEMYFDPFFLQGKGYDMKHVVRHSQFGTWPSFDTRLRPCRVLADGSPARPVHVNCFVFFARRSTAVSVFGGLDYYMWGSFFPNRGLVVLDLTLCAQCEITAKSQPALRHTPLPKPTLFTGWGLRWRKATRWRRAGLLL